MMLRGTQMRLVSTIFVIGWSALWGQEFETPPAPAGLHLLAATPTPIQFGGYETELYKLNAEGGLSLVRSLGTKDVGVDFILADFAGRRIVSASPNITPDHLDVIDMDAAQRSGRVQLNLSEYSGAPWKPWSAQVLAMSQKAGIRDDHISVVHGKLLNRPGMGPWLTLELASNKGTVLIGVALEGLPGAALGKTEILEPAAMSNFLVQGEFGLVNRGTSDVVFTSIKDKEIFFGVNGTQIDTGIPAPDVETTPKDIWMIVAHDNSTTVMRRLKEPAATSVGDGSSPLYVFSAESRTWKTYTVPGSSPRIKMIGPWIMGVAASDVNKNEKRESPGKAGRRQTEANSASGSKIRPITELRFRDSGKYLPGILFLINPNTGSYIPLRTDQGDSEILLVDNNSVYYRTNNQLLVAPLQDNKIGPGKLLAEDDAIPEVHWAFIGH